MNTLLCCIGRKENRYIREYVEYYKNLGFTNICLMDNNYDGEENFNDVIGDYISSGFVILKDYRNRVSCQMSGYQACYDEYKDKYDWIAFFDCDEFLTLTQSMDISSYLSSILFKNYQLIHINWMIYGDSGRLDYDERGVLERFTEPCDFDTKCGYNFPENYHVKTIIRGGLDNVTWTTRVNNHTPNIHGLKCCDASGCVCDANSPFVPYNYTKAYIRHFSTKTAGEYANKMKNGFPDHAFNENEIKTLVETRFFKYNKPTKEKIDMFIEKLGIDLSYLLPKDTNKIEKSDDVKIYSLCFSKKSFEFLNDKVITPLQVGADINKDDVCELKDNTGDNISSSNFFYIENTGIYWIWKNIHGCKYKGQMQYRRPLEGVNESMDFDAIFDKYDVITCKPFHHPDHKTPTKEEPMIISADTVEQGYAFSNCIVDIHILETIIKNYYPEYKESYEKYIKNGEDLYYSSGFIMKEADYDRYCTFLFGVLSKYLKLTGISTKEELYFHVGRNLGAGFYGQRYKNPYEVPMQAVKWQTEIGGFLGERIWTLWCLHNFKKDKIYETPYIKMEQNMYT